MSSIWFCIALLRDATKTIRRKCCSVTIWLATSVASVITSISVRMGRKVSIACSWRSVPIAYLIIDAPSASVTREGWMSKGNLAIP